MKILLAGPGTGKTTNIKKIIAKYGNGPKFLVLSFTNATVKDLQSNLADQGITDSNCMTLHKFAIKYNHDHERHVLLQREIQELKQIVKGTKIDFEELCNSLKCTTFNQMIERFVVFAKTNPAYLKQKLINYDSLIIDEYQDFNPSEQKLIDILIQEIPNSYILGDDDQCIYDFKDASSDKIIAFHGDPMNEIIPHEHKCYRCPDKVIEHATYLIQNNKKRVNKKWEKTGKPGEIEYFQLINFDEVAINIIDKLSNLKNENVLILTPVEFVVTPLIKLLEENRIAFTNCFKPMIPDDLVIRSWEIKSFFGMHKYLNLVLFGYNILKNRSNFYKMIKNHFDTGLNFDELFELLINKLPNEMLNGKLSLIDFLSQKRYEDIFLLFNKLNIDSEEGLERLFKNIDEVEEKNVKIMSIHKSKGLGADYVFIVGLNEGILPNKKKGNDTIESQRRLFYVGITRAKKQLFLYSNLYMGGRYVNKVNKEDFQYDYKSKLWVGKSSMFISELKLNS